jgi:hypothetical protein
MFNQKILCIGSNSLDTDKRVTNLAHKNNSIKTSASPIIERNNWTIELIEDYPCNNLHELLTRERYYIDNNECVNKVRPTRTLKEWVTENNEQVALYQKQ